MLWSVELLRQVASGDRWNRQEPSISRGPSNRSDVCGLFLHVRLRAVAGRGNLGAAIRNARQRLGLTQQALAQELGVTRATVNTWESGKAHPRGKLPLIYDLIDRSEGTRPQGPSLSVATTAELLAELARRVERGERAIALLAEVQSAEPLLPPTLARDAPEVGKPAESPGEDGLATEQ